MDFKKSELDNFFEHCLLPGKIAGYKVNSEREIHFVGITGLGSSHERNGKKSIWINGEILSPNFIGNDNCSCKSHIEGIVTEKGEMRLLEAVYDFPAHKDDCIEYILNAMGGINIRYNSLIFEGKLIARLNKNNFQPLDAGGISFVLDPFYSIESRSIISHSLPYHNRHLTNNLIVPNFWDVFLGELEEEGYEHPYMAINYRLLEERVNKKIARTESHSTLSDNKNPDDIPF